MDPDKQALLAQVGEAFAERGFEGLLPFTHPEFEFHEPPEQPGAAVFKGREACREGWARWAEGWTEQRSELQDARELDDGRILVLTRETLRGRDGIEVTQDGGHILTLQGDKLLRLQSFWDRGNAFAAAGLE